VIKTNLGIDKIYVINLPNRKDRRQEFDDTFGKLKYEYIDAIAGKNIDIPKLIKQKRVSQIFYDPGGMVNRNVIACNLSHLKVWETFLKDDVDTCLVFEDDVMYVDEIFNTTTDTNTNEVVVSPTRMWKDIKGDIDNFEWDIIFLGKKEKYVDGVDETELFCKPFWSAGMFGGHSYMLNKKSIKKLISSYKPIQYAADVYLDMMSEKMNVYALKKSLFRQRTDIYLHDKKLYHKVDSDTFYNQYRKEKFTEVRVDETVESIEFINYPVSPEFDKKRWPPLIKAKLRN
tara:strand:+ start:438 stop:1298 length:861 start_codon:yes stop_codon:yes gene_type:complete